jgi:hypothetical protein
MMKYLLPVVATVLSLAAYADEVNPDDRMVSNGPMVPIAVSVAVVALGAAIVAFVAWWRRRGA